MTGDQIFDLFNIPSERGSTSLELTKMGATALPILESIFDCTAKNSFGIPLRKFGTALDCAIIAAGRLGAIGKPLEKYLLAELRSGHRYAAEALGGLGELGEESIAGLIATLSGTDLVQQFEAAHALILCGAEQHNCVQEAVTSSPAIEEVMKQAREFHLKTIGPK